MLIIIPAVIFFTSLCCSNILDDTVTLKDIRENLYPRCDNKTMVNLLSTNKNLRAEAHRHLFCQYNLDALIIPEKKIANVLISRYFIISMYTEYRHTIGLFKTHRAQCELFPKAEEKVYLKILAKNTQFYTQCRKNWLPMKKDIFKHFVEHKNDLSVIMFDLIFKKGTYIYKIEKDTLWITKESETTLKKRRLFHYFYAFHAIINTISKIKQITIKERNNEDWSIFYVFSYLLGSYGIQPLIRQK